MFEKCLHNRLYSYFNKYDILTPNQFGFKQNSSTSHAVRQLYDECIDNLDETKLIYAVFLDLKKAFDRVNHQILLQKLEKYGVRGLPLQLLTSYISDRIQYTVVNNHKSNICSVTCGVPQGSTLGPLLFIIYINDLPLASNLNTKLFADDAVLTSSNKCLKTLITSVNCELGKIDDWMKINKLTFNYDKTTYMIITQKKEKPQSEVKIGKNTVEEVSQIKYLGVFFDEKLSWKKHIQYIYSKLFSGSWALLKLRNYVDISTLKIVYYRLIYYHLQYCISS